MAKVKGFKITKTEVSQTINLKELFGVDLRARDSLKQALGQAIIDVILDRTEKGKGIDGRNLKRPYSKSYIASEDFKAFGKSPGRVNMSLTGDMLGQMNVISTKGNKIKIGWGAGSPENAKAFNHVTGDTVPRRPFFGVNGKELAAIKGEFKAQVKTIADTLSIEGRDSFEAEVLALLKRLEENGDEV